MVGSAEVAAVGDRGSRRVRVRVGEGGEGAMEVMSFDETDEEIEDAV